MKYYLALFFFFYCIGLSAQQDSLPVYFVEEQELVLEFDIRKYQGEQKKTFAEIFEMKEVDVIGLIQQKESWSQDGWRLQKINKHIYQIRKALDAFDQPLPWVSKYSISGANWVEPVSEVDPTVDSNLIESIFNPDTKTMVIAENGNTTFQLANFQKAKKVILSGSFNNWNEEEIQMLPTDSGWTISLDLQHGIYEYKFIVNGKWMHDPINELKVLNEHDTWNSILLVGQNIVFNLPDHQDAKRVVLSGSFNSWNENAFQMKKQGNGWYLDVPLPPGKHYYKFIIDGKWILDPDNNLQQPDRKGNWNSVLLIH